MKSWTLSGCLDYFAWGWRTCNCFAFRAIYRRELLRVSKMGYIHATSLGFISHFLCTQALATPAHKICNTGEASTLVDQGGSVYLHELGCFYCFSWYLLLKIFFVPFFLYFAVLLTILTSTYECWTNTPGCSQKSLQVLNSQIWLIDNECWYVHCGAVWISLNIHLATFYIFASICMHSVRTSTWKH